MKKKQHGRLLSMALSGAMVVSSLSMTVPMTALAASPSGITATVTLAGTKALKSNTAFAVSANLDDALEDSGEIVDYDTVGFTISEEPLTKETVVDETPVDGENRTGTNSYDATLDLSTLEKGGTYVVQAWNYESTGDGIELLGTSEPITVYANHAGDISVTSSDTSIAVGQGSITATFTGTLNVPNTKDTAAFDYVVLTEADYEKFDDAIKNGTFGNDAKVKGKSKAVAAAGATAEQKASNFLLATKERSMATDGSSISQEVTVSLDKTATMTAGKYYLVAAVTPDVNLAAVTTEPLKAVKEFSVVAAEGSDLVIGTELKDGVPTLPTDTKIYLGTDVAFHAYVLGEDRKTYVEADKSKVKWYSTAPAYVTIGETTGVAHGVKKSDAGSKIYVKYTPDKGDVVDTSAAEAATKKNFTFVSVAYDVIAVENDITLEEKPYIEDVYLNVPKQLKATNKAGVNITKDVEWSVVGYVNAGTDEVPDWKEKELKNGEASVSTDGKLTVKKTGTYKVKATYQYADPTQATGNFVYCTIEPAALKVTTKSGNDASDKGEPHAIKYAENDATLITTVELEKGDSASLVVKLDTVNKTSDANTKYSSDDEKVATFKDGVITAVGKGTANVTVSRDDAEPTQQTIVVNVSDPDGYAVLDKNLKDEITILVGDSFELGLYKDEVPATMTSGTWKSSRASVAKVSTNGTVTGLAAGYTTITLTDAVVDGKVVEPKEYYVEVLAKDTVVYSYDYYGTEIHTYDDELYAGNTRQYKATVNGKTVEGTWSLAEGDGITVSSQGLVTAKAVGEGNEVVFTPKDSNVATATLFIDVLTADFVLTANDNVIEAEEEQELANLALAEGSEVQLKAYNGPEDITSSVKFESSNTDYVTVSAKGVVKGIKVTEGLDSDVTITATRTTDKAAVGEFTVTVTGELNTATVSLSSQSLTLEENGESSTIKAVVEPVGTADKLAWTVDDKDGVISFKDNGDGTVTITPVKIGTAKVTAKSGEKSATCSIEVVQSKASKAEEQAKKEQAKKDAIAAATTAANAAASNPTDANLAALEKAIADAKAAGASDADVKAAEEKLTAALKTAKANSDKTAADNKTAADKANQEATAAKAEAATAKTEAANQKAAADAANKKVAAQFETLKKVEAANGYVVNTFKNGEATLVSIPANKTKATFTIASKVKVNGKTYKVTKIAAKALKTNTKIKTLTVPATVKQIGANAVGSKVTKLTVKGSNVQVLNNALKSINKKAKVIAKNKYTRTQLQTFGNAKKTVTFSAK